MQHLYMDNFAQKRKPKRRVWQTMLLLALDLLLLMVTIAASVGLIIALVTRYFDPATIGRVGTIVLAAPLLFLIELVTMFYWLVRWRLKVVAVVASILIISLFTLDKYYGVRFKKQGNIEYNERNYINLLSYNIANGDNDAIVDSVATLQADIICLQEYMSDSDVRWKRLKRYNSTFNGENDFSNEILSRYKIIEQGKIDTLPRYNAIWADLLIRYDTIRVVNLHLQSTSLREADTQFIQLHEYILDTARTTKFRDIVSRLSENNIKRAAQVKVVTSLLDEMPDRPTIVCGDFNDTPLSHTMREFDARYRNCFEEAGYGYNYTFDGFFRLLCIDYIYVSEHFEIETYEILRSFDHSDHYPIMTRLKLKK